MSSTVPVATDVSARAPGPSADGLRNATVADGGSSRSITKPDRVLGHVVGSQTGATLVCVAGLHGNEPAGFHGVLEVLNALRARTSCLRGTFLGLTGNRQALVEGSRFIDRDLNRLWVRDRLAALRAGTSPIDAEEREMRELDLELRAAIGNATGPVVLLDLHTTSAPGPAFVVLNDTLANRALALQFSVPVVLGLEEELEGTLLSYLSRAENVTSIGFESGQHDEPEAVDKAAAAIWLALETSGLIDTADWPEIAQAHALLEAEGAGLPPMVDVHHRHHIEPEDDFQMSPGFVGFQAVRKGQVLGTDRSGTVTSPRDGLLLMPLYQGQGDDGFFVVSEIRPIWLRLSAALRRRHLEGYLHWLPGIRRHASIPDAVVVDRRVARVLALEFFHLLGFTLVGQPDERYLVMRRRREVVS